MAYTHLNRAVKRVRKGKNPATPPLARRALFAFGKPGRQAEAKWHRRVAWYAGQALERLEEERIDIIEGNYSFDPLEVRRLPHKDRKKRFLRRAATGITAGLGLSVVGALLGLPLVIAGVAGSGVSASGVQRAITKKPPRESRITQELDQFFRKDGIWFFDKKQDVWVKTAGTQEYRVHLTPRDAGSRRQEFIRHNEAVVNRLKALLRAVKDTHTSAWQKELRPAREKKSAIPPGI